MSDYRASPGDPDDRERPLPAHLDPRRGEPRRASRRSAPGRESGRNVGRAAAGGRSGAQQVGPSGRHARPATRQRRRRPWATPIKFVAAAVSLIVLATSGVMWGFYQDFNGKVRRLAVHEHAGGDIDGKDQNILLVGNDNRAGLTAAQLKEVGTTANEGLNTDTILLIHLPADGRKATVISFPRDSWVKIPGFADNRINAAYADGACSQGCGTLTKQQQAAGADELIKTVSNLTGVHIDHYAEVSLLGFYTISNIIGGVDVCLARRAYDPGYTNLDLSAGHHTLKGTQALLFVRQRHNLPRGDLDRIVRQQVFISAMLRKVLSAGTLLNPIRLHRLANAVAKSLTFDQTLDPIRLAEQMRNLAAGNVSFSTIPTQGPARIDGKDVIAVDPAKVRAYIRQVIGRTEPKKPAPAHHAPAPTVAPGQVTVAVYNGTTEQGLAGRTGGRLSDAGYTVAGTANADRQDYATTQIRYSPAQAAAARTLHKVVPDATMSEDDSLGATVDLVLGSDFSGLSTGSTPDDAGTPPAQPTQKPRSRTAADTGCVN